MAASVAGVPRRLRRSRATYRTTSARKSYLGLAASVAELAVQVLIREGFRGADFWRPSIYPLVAYSATFLRSQKRTFTGQLRAGLVPPAHETGAVQDRSIRLQHVVPPRALCSRNSVLKLTSIPS